MSADLPATDRTWMQRAIALAWSERPSPNPRVGSVLVHEGVVVGEGAHRVAGEDHAEIVALKQAGERAAGSTMYVTLEPHCYHARTPPCTDALIAARVARVVLGVPDPNPRVAGRGIEQLRAAGIEVTLDVERDGCVALIRAWTRFITRGMPWVVLKAGMSLDGRIATRTRESQWITGPDARRDGHRLRARADAVMVGIGTVLADDPMLTPRDVERAGMPPARIVLDSALRIPTECALVRTAHEAPTWVLHADTADAARAKALQDRGVITLPVSSPGGRVALHEALGLLGRRGVVEVLCEGGGTVHGALLDAGLADALVCYVAPVILGGRDAIAAFGGEGVARLADARRLRNVSIDRLGDDLRLAAEFDDVHRDHHGHR